MNRTILFLLAATASALSTAELPKADPEELYRLIEDLVSYTTVFQLVQTIESKESRPDQVEYARGRIAKAKESIPQLRKLITVGSNILDYPGLLTRGYVTYHRNGAKGSYDLWISATYAGREASVFPWEFRLDFDDRGIITDVYDVKWKK